jgi:hypothetical protein
MNIAELGQCYPQQILVKCKHAAKDSLYTQAALVQIRNNKDSFL